MKLRELLSGVSVLACTADMEMEISGVSYDSRSVRPGDLFVAMTGFAVDGHKFIAAAQEKGAAAALCQKEPGGTLPYVRTEDSRRALAIVGANWFGHPAKEMTMVAVTGTCGKTTTTYLLKAILEQAAGAKVGLIGTNQNMIGNAALPTDRTTPESFEVQKLFREMADAGCTHVVMETSSHALYLDRVYGGERYELYLIELPSTAAAASLRAAAALRSRGRRTPMAFLAHTPAHAYSAYRVDAMQYLLLPVPPEQLMALLARATEPEYGPAIPVATASGLRVLPFADIEYLECTHHVVHFHLASGEDVPSLSVRVPFAQVAQPLLADERFVQLHRSYVVNLAAVSQLAASEFWMQSGARVPVPRGREPAARTALRDYLEKQFQ